MTNEPQHPDRSSLCLLRIDGPDNGWCIRVNCDGDHIGYPSKDPVETNTFGPEQAQARRWR